MEAYWVPLIEIISLHLLWNTFTGIYLHENLSYECNLHLLQTELKEGSSVMSSKSTNISAQYKKIKYF